MTNVPEATTGLAWPSRLDLASDGRRLVYLDLNHWIQLTRAAKGQSAPPGYQGLLDVARDSVRSNAAIFPLSGVHYMEMSHISNPRQREDIAKVMEELSDFRVLLSRTVLMRLEIEAALDKIMGLPSSGVQVPLLGRSFAWAFGKQGGLRIKSRADDEDLTDDHSDKPWFNEATRMVERRMLAGPSDQEAEHLRQTAGYRPEEAQALAERRAQQERDLAAILDAEPVWRRGRLRDLISARELTLEWIDAVTEVVLHRNTTIGKTVGTEREAMRAFADSIPSSHVAVTMKTAYHRDGLKQWIPNDIRDIDALATAVPYCDAVFTDKAARNALNPSRMSTAVNTHLPRTTADLISWLRETL